MEFRKLEKRLIQKSILRPFNWSNSWILWITYQCLVNQPPWNIILDIIYSNAESQYTFLWCGDLIQNLYYHINVLRNFRNYFSAMWRTECLQRKLKRISSKCVKKKIGQILNLTLAYRVKLGYDFGMIGGCFGGVC